MAQIINATWPMIHEGTIHFQNMVCPYYSQMYVMAEKLGSQKVVHPGQSLFPIVNYGYYELFICRTSQNHISNGCQQEISMFDSLM
jgi:hypothetical protein